MPGTRDKADHERLYLNHLAEAARAGRDAGRYTAARCASPGIRACRRANPARGAAALLRHVSSSRVTALRAAHPRNTRPSSPSSGLSFALKALLGSARCPSLLSPPNPVLTPSLASRPSPGGTGWVSFAAAPSRRHHLEASRPTPHPHHAIRMRRRREPRHERSARPGAGPRREREVVCGPQGLRDSRVRDCPTSRDVR